MLNSCLIFPENVIADSTITAEDEGATELKDKGSVDDDGGEEEETDELLNQLTADGIPGATVMKLVENEWKLCFDEKARVIIDENLLTLTFRFRHERLLVLRVGQVPTKQKGPDKPLLIHATECYEVAPQEVGTKDAACYRVKVHKDHMYELSEGLLKIKGKIECADA